MITVVILHAEYVGGELGPVNACCFLKLIGFIFNQIFKVIYF